MLPPSPSVNQTAAYLLSLSIMLSPTTHHTLFFFRLGFLLFFLGGGSPCMFVKTFLSFPEHTNHSFVILYPRPLKEKEQMMPTLTPPTKPSRTVKRAQASYRAAYLFSKLKITITLMTPGATYTPTCLPDCTPPPCFK